jgi:osmotically inducible protein OsmC
MALAFALAKEGASDGNLETRAKVDLDKDGDGLKIARSDLDLTADVPGIDDDKLRRLAEDAKANCPISKLLNAEMGLTVRTAAEASS